MAKSLNRWQGIGNLGGDVELKYTPAGKAVANFTVACNESWKDDAGNMQEKVEWVRIVAWEKLAEICSQYLKKGSKVYVEGKLQTRSWEKDGQKHFATEVVINNMLMLDTRPTQGQSETSQQPQRQATTVSGPVNDDLPF